LQVSDPACQIICGGSWTRHATNGLFQHGGGLVTFNTESSPTNITPANSPFYDVVFDNEGTVFNLLFTSANTITIENDLTITRGSVKPFTNAYILNIQNDFFVAATDAEFLPNSGVSRYRCFK
jgi:hypothetical protein